MDTERRAHAQCPCPPAMRPDRSPRMMNRVIGEEPWSMHDGGAIEAGGRERLVERGRDVGGAHRGTKPPGHDVTREVVEHGRQIIHPQPVILR